MAPTREGPQRVDWDLVDEAVEFAARAHAGQTRKGTDLPYISHPVAVAMLLASAGCDRDVVVAALLHDVVEDAGVRLKDVADRFGDPVAAIVAACSEDKSLSWEERKSRTLECLPGAPLSVKLVTCADKLHNLRHIRREQALLGDAVWDRFRRGRDRQAWYFRGLARAFAREVEQGAYPQIFAAFAREVAAMFPG